MNTFCRHRLFHMLRSIGLAAAVAVTGCTNIAAPKGQMIISKTAIGDAIDAGSSEFSPRQLKIALDKMNAAEQAMIEEDYLRAWQLAEQVQVDAQLAALSARVAKAQKTAYKLQEDNHTLQQEIERNAQ